MNFVHFLSLPGKQNLVPMQLNLHFNPYIDSAQLKGLFRKPFCVTIWTKFLPSSIPAVQVQSSWN